MTKIRFGALSLVAMLVIAFAAPLGAQDDDMFVEILPINRAQFLPGAMFDMRVELQGMEALPEDFAVTIDGEPVADFFGAEVTEETYEFGADENGEGGTPVASVVARDLTFMEPGEYMVEVVADGETTTALYTVREPMDFGGRNVILFIADGGSVPANTAARLLSRGMERGFYNDRLSFETFEEIGLLSTSGTDSIMTDSANSASSYNTGHKSAVNATGVYADSSPDAYDDPRVETFAEMIKRTRGMSVGVVATSYAQDATPAAVWGHSRERNTRSRSDFPLQAIGFEDALGNPFTPVMLDVYLGGGSRYNLPNTVEGSIRPDEVDVFAEYENVGYTVVTNNTELQAAVEEGAAPILGTFAINDLNVWLDRNVYTDNLESDDQPGLVDMTIAALDVLSQNENGFYLQVEAASVDKQFHPMDFERGLADLIEFDRAVAATLEYLEANGTLDETLIVVTADHGHSFDVFGTVDVPAFNAAEDDLGKRDAIGVYSDAGFPAYEDADGDFFPDDWDVERTLAWGKVENPPFTEDYQVSVVPRNPSISNEEGIVVDNAEDDPNGLVLGGNLPTGTSSSVHTLQDVPVFSQGPGSEQLGSSLENIEVFFAMAGAIGLDPRESME